MRVSMRLLFGVALTLLFTGAQAVTYQRIVTLAPHLAELVYAAGAGSKLVGVSTYSDFPAEVANVPVVASDGRVNFEALYRLKPDLVLAWRSGNRAADFEELERRGFNVIMTEAASLSDVARLIRQFGALAGTAGRAEENARSYETRIAALRQRYEKRAPVRAFVEIWHEPLMTVNGAHVISEVLRVCGAVNVFGDAGLLTPIVSSEQLYARRPEVMLSTAFADQQTLRDAWRSFGALDAVAHQRLFNIDRDALARMGPRLADGAAEVCAAVDTARQAMH